jgi:ribosomal protein S18 acetylase RimI-like enzyme
MTQLDNPVWNALITTHQKFAIGTHAAKRYPADVLPFVSFDPSAANPIGTLKNAVGDAEIVCVVGDLPQLPASWTVLHELECNQMVCPELREVKVDGAIQPAKLGEEEETEMFELINSIQPGFYKHRTASLGNYYGIRVNGKLVSMAGERLKITGLTEVSAVCTHPDYIGKGFAAQLVSTVCKHTIGLGNTPFLHVLSSNLRAIQLYERLGFVNRRGITFWLLKTSAV